MKNKSAHLRRLCGLLCLAAAVFIICSSNGVFGENLRLFFLKDGFSNSFDETQDFVKVMDVWQADSILIYSNGQSAVIDCGYTFSINEIAENLQMADISEPDVMLVTHFHADHAGGIEDLSRLFYLRNLILPLENEKSELQAAVDAAKRNVSKKGGKIYTAVQGMSFNIGEFECTLLCSYADMKNINNRSVALMAEIDGIKFLFTGDAEKETEKALLDEGIKVDCDVLKVGHHGSSSSSTKEFIDAASPDYAVISVGKDNKYSHPSQETMDRLKNADAEIFRTDRDGDVTFFVENGAIRVETQK